MDNLDFTTPITLDVARTNTVKGAKEGEPSSYTVKGSLSMTLADALALVESSIEARVSAFYNKASSSAKSEMQAGEFNDLDVFKDFILEPVYPSNIAPNKKGAVEEALTTWMDGNEKITKAIKKFVLDAFKTPTISDYHSLYETYEATGKVKQYELLHKVAVAAGQTQLASIIERAKTYVPPAAPEADDLGLDDLDLEGMF